MPDINLSNNKNEQAIPLTNFKEIYSKSENIKKAIPSNQIKITKNSNPTEDNKNDSI